MPFNIKSLPRYRKGIAAFATSIIPLLNQAGVPLPGFLTADWLNAVLLSLTTVLVVLIGNEEPT